MQNWRKALCKEFDLRIIHWCYRLKKKKTVELMNHGFWWISMWISRRTKKEVGNLTKKYCEQTNRNGDVMGIQWEIKQTRVCLKLGMYSEHGKPRRKMMIHHWIFGYLGYSVYYTYVYTYICVHISPLTLSLSLSLHIYIICI